MKQIDIQYIKNNDMYDKIKMYCPKCYKDITISLIIKEMSDIEKLFYYECNDCSSSIKLYYNYYNNKRSLSWYQKTIPFIRNKYKITDIISVGIMSDRHYYFHKFYQYSEIIDYKIRVIIKGKPFLQCSLAVMQFTKEEAEDEDTDNMDDHLKAHGIENLDDYKAQITMEEELFVHASNIQAFVENDYNMGILLESYSIPLLKELVRVGDRKAEYALYEQLTEKWNEGGNNQKIALFDKFPEYLINLANNNVIPLYDFIIKNAKNFTTTTHINIFFNKSYSNLPKKVKKCINFKNILKLETKESKKLSKLAKIMNRKSKKEYKKIMKEFDKNITI